MGAKILVADDSITIQTAVQLTFGRENVELIPARSGEEAIRKAKEVAPDLMLIDTVMPDTSGYDLCRTLKADPAMQDVPVIMLTGPFEAPDRAKGQMVGVSEFLAKPFESQALIRKVSQLLDARPTHLSASADVKRELEAMDVGSHRAQFDETGALVLELEEEQPFAGSLTPPAVPPLLSGEEGWTPLLEEPPAASEGQPVAVPAEFPRHMLEQAVTQAAEQAVTKMAKGVEEKLAERIEQIVREVVPVLAESLILKEIERIKASIEDKAAE